MAAETQGLAFGRAAGEWSLALAAGALFGLGDVMMKVTTEAVQARLSSFDLSRADMLTALVGTPGFHLGIAATAAAFRRRVILDAGHFVKQEHALITTGAYGFVRNPMYLGIILLWLGIAISSQSLLLLLVASGYVMPVLWLYTRAAERMLTSEFGVAFEAYCRCVGRLLPRLR